MQISYPVCRKSLLFQKRAYPQPLSPLGHSVDFASCKAWCVLISASLPKTLSPVKGCVCLVGSASCRTSGIHARHPCRGYINGATAPIPCKDACSQPFVPLHDAVAQMADDLYGGSAPATPLLNKQKVFRQADAQSLL